MLCVREHHVGLNWEAYLGGLRGGGKKIKKRVLPKTKYSNLVKGFHVTESSFIFKIHFFKKVAFKVMCQPTLLFVVFLRWRIQHGIDSSICPSSSATSRFGVSNRIFQRKRKTTRSRRGQDVLGCPRKLGSMVRISGLFHLLINGVYWGEITH